MDPDATLGRYDATLGRSDATLVRPDATLGRSDATVVGSDWRQTTSNKGDLAYDDYYTEKFVKQNKASFQDKKLRINGEVYNFEKIVMCKSTLADGRGEYYNYTVVMGAIFNKLGKKYFIKFFLNRDINKEAEGEYENGMYMNQNINACIDPGFQCFTTLAVVERKELKILFGELKPLFQNNIMRFSNTLIPSFRYFNQNEIISSDFFWELLNRDDDPPSLRYIPFIISRLIDGEDLIKVMREESSVRIEYFSVADKFLSQLLSSLYKMHKKGIYHWDVKPHNIMYDHNGNSFTLFDYGTVIYQSASGYFNAKISFQHPKISEDRYNYGYNSKYAVFHDIYPVAYTYLQMMRYILDKFPEGERENIIKKYEYKIKFACILMSLYNFIDSNTKLIKPYLILLSYKNIVNELMEKNPSVIVKDKIDKDMAIGNASKEYKLFMENLDVSNSANRYGSGLQTSNLFDRLIKICDV